MLMRTNGRTETGSAYQIQITIFYTRPMDKIKMVKNDIGPDTYSDFSIFGRCSSNRPCCIIPGIFERHLLKKIVPFPLKWDLLRY